MLAILDANEKVLSVWVFFLLRVELGDLEWLRHTAALLLRNPALLQQIPDLATAVLHPWNGYAQQLIDLRNH